MGKEIESRRRGRGEKEAEKKKKKTECCCHTPTTATSTVLDSGLGADGVAVSVSALGLQTQSGHARGLLGGQTSASQSPCQWHLRAVLVVNSPACSCPRGGAARESQGDPGAQPAARTAVSWSQQAQGGEHMHGLVCVAGRQGLCRTADGLAHLSFLKKKGQCAPRQLIRAKPPNTHSLSE